VSQRRLGTGARETTGTAAHRCGDGGTARRRRVTGGRGEAAGSGLGDAASDRGGRGASCRGGGASGEAAVGRAQSAGRDGTVGGRGKQGAVGTRGEREERSGGRARRAGQLSGAALSRQRFKPRCQHVTWWPRGSGELPRWPGAARDG
jgi:hypothetical protein